MGRLKQKLKSEYGASILLALLFFLICGLVTAALLMSAVSNAGKIKNNEESHQKYLTVSSALQMVCEDLLSEPYVAKYNYTKIPPATQEGENGEQIITAPEERRYTQLKGKYECGMGKYILDELDSLFDAQMKMNVDTFRTAGQNIDNTIWTYTRRADNPISSPTSSSEDIIYTFEVTPTGTSGGDTEKVMIYMTLDRTTRSYTINLTARLESDPVAYAMRAELTPDGNPPKITAEPDLNKDYEIELKWKLGWITKAE